MTDPACDLKNKKCAPCSGQEPPLKGDALKPYVQALDTNWKVGDDRRLVRVFKTQDFMSALAFTVLVGELSEREGHHPVIELTWGRVTVSLWTHKIGGLSENDFILAAKIDGLKMP